MEGTTHADELRLVFDDVGIDGGVELHSFPVQTNQTKREHQLEDTRDSTSLSRDSHHMIPNLIQNSLRLLDELYRCTKEQLRSVKRRIEERDKEGGN